MQVEVRHLRAFVAVAEELNFTRAAERLHLAQQALSSQIQQLEKRMDAQLFLRTSRRVEHVGGVPDERPVMTTQHMGSLFDWHVDGAASGGGLSLAEVLVSAGGEPPLHVHAREDEVFYVLEGQVTFMRGVEQIEAGPGSCVVLPRGIQHGFAVQTPTARMR